MRKDESAQLKQLDFVKMYADAVEEVEKQIENPGESEIQVVFCQKILDVLSKMKSEEYGNRNSNSKNSGRCLEER